MTRSSDLLSKVEAALGRPGAASSDFDLNPATVLRPDRKLRDAAVLVLLDDLGKQPMVTLTKRASGLKHHPGQIAFPGGKRDKEDVDLQSTALREAHEEISLPPNATDVLGTLPSHETVTGFSVKPYIARLKRDYAPRPEAGEVAEIFTVPLNHLLNPANYLIERRRWRGATRYYYTVPYGPYYIWGATARMLRALAEQVAK